MQKRHDLSSFTKTEEKAITFFLYSFWIPTVEEIKHIKVIFKETEVSFNLEKQNSNSLD